VKCLKSSCICSKSATSIRLQFTLCHFVFLHELFAVGHPFEVRNYGSWAPVDQQKNERINLGSQQEKMALSCQGCVNCLGNMVSILTA
jgi:hypothetical protein